MRNLSLETEFINL